MPNRIAIFTDLDGTLIRHEDYSFAPVKALLRKLQFKHIPVVLASSKTRAEIEHGASSAHWKVIRRRWRGARGI